MVNKKNIEILNTKYIEGINNKKKYIRTQFKYVTIILIYIRKKEHIK